ncbi:nucleotide-binding universal stress UspA family protein [Kitasatospora sp. MAP12-15]|uniref:universal stress protein n=1 Tax=unclassified Kitasatospora TaxID=2633591 RepID=UPI00247552FB|nr:universal stress protein [Kitasatospora sp. MAP12-44]MDH6115499.1 nucleotide-binding universal stress UspA family protein [Kitasatospora sp. MAP12-44]
MRGPARRQHATTPAGADLLVLGRRIRRHGTPRIGPAAHALVHHIQCPIAVVPHV